MYPNLYYIFKDLFGIDLFFLRYIGTFGFFVVLAFLAGIYFLRKDIRQKEALGYYSLKKETLVNSHKPARKKPGDDMANIISLAVLFGYAGGKLFYIFEHWQSFVIDPWNIILSLSGVNFYGSVILSSVVIWFYYSRNNIKPIYLADSYAPALMIAYSIGRLGCHLSGDGDWGITNTAAKPFSWLPGWLWSYTYPHNVMREGEIMKHCDWGNYCYQLTAPVFPTPLYEAIICFVLFLVLWSVRNKITKPGVIGALFLILAGVERFLIETIRINPVIEWLNITQAQLISIMLIMTGTLVIIFKYTGAKSPAS